MLIASTCQLVSLPELLGANLDANFCIGPQGNFTRRRLLTHALALSEQLPDYGDAINLCEDRYLFIVAFIAVLLRERLTLLPHNQSPRTIQSLLKAYPKSYCLTDSAIDLPSENSLVSYAALTESHARFPVLNLDRIVSISFTSGSTGEPKPIPKTLREFKVGAELAVTQFDLAGLDATLVSTATPQHMYGLETSFFWPLFSRLAIFNCRPFYPEDVRRCLAKVEGPAVLVGTPTHLKACVQSNVLWPENLIKILSSTAPMPPELARLAEQKMNAPLYELFGSTETQSIALRRPAQTDRWRLYEGMQLHHNYGQFSIAGGHLAEAIDLDDKFAIDESPYFKILGRSKDLIKIAGKRTSLAELNLLLNSITGIEDGVFFESRAERLSIMVVSELSKQAIVDELKASIDPVFLPRNVIRVAKLPRNGMGKLNKLELDKLIQDLELA